MFENYEESGEVDVLCRDLIAPGRSADVTRYVEVPSMKVVAISSCKNRFQTCLVKDRHAKAPLAEIR